MVDILSGCRLGKRSSGLVRVRNITPSHCRCTFTVNLVEIKTVERSFALICYGNVLNSQGLLGVVEDPI